MSVPEMLFEEEIIGGGDMIMLICFNASRWVFEIKIKLRQLFEDSLIDRDSMIPYHNSTVKGYRLLLFAPWMSINFL